MNIYIIFNIYKIMYRNKLYLYEITNIKIAIYQQGNPADNPENFRANSLLCFQLFESLLLIKLTKIVVIVKLPV